MIEVFLMVVGTDGRHVGNMESVQLPHVPQIGSNLVMTPPGGEEPKDDRVYVIVGVRYVMRRSGEKRPAHVLHGWEIAVTDGGPYSEWRYTIPDNARPREKKQLEVL